MPELTDEETFLKLVTDRLRKSGIEVDEKTDVVTGDLTAIVFAVLDTYDRNSPVLFGD